LGRKGGAREKSQDVTSGTAVRTGELASLLGWREYCRDGEENREEDQLIIAKDEADKDATAYCTD